jgi:hypothetical protein
VNHEAHVGLVDACHARAVTSNATAVKATATKKLTHAKRDGGHDDLDLIGRPVSLDTRSFVGLHAGVVVVDA